MLKLRSVTHHTFRTHKNVPQWRRSLSTASWSPQSNSFLVVGSEIETLICATRLKASGFKTTLLYDKPPLNPEKMTVLSINATRLLATTICPTLYREKIKPASFELQILSKQSHKGLIWGQIDYASMSKLHGYEQRVIPHDDLWKILFQNFKQQGGDIVSNTSIESIEQVAKKENTSEVVVRCSGGSSMTYDFLIGADGPDSKVRELLWKPNEIEAEYTIQHFFTTVPPPPKTAIAHRVAQMWGPTSMLTVLPVSPRLFSISGYKLFDTNDTSSPRPTSCTSKEFIQQFLEFGGPWPELVDQFKTKNVHIEYLSNLKMISRPYYNHVILIGSAARGIFPAFLGHEVGQAIEDASLLPELLTGQKSQAGLEQAFTVFDDMRKPRVDFCFESAISEMVGSLSPQSPWKQKLRDMLLQLNNTTGRLQETENRLIGVDPERLSRV